jgi:hypothetical protein
MFGGCRGAVKDLTRSAVGGRQAVVTVGRRIRLTDLEGVLAELSYPTTESVAAAAFEDVTIDLSDGEVARSDHQ